MGALCGKIRRTPDGHEDAGAQGAVHSGLGLGPQLPQGKEHDKLGRAEIHVLSRAVAVAQELYFSAGGRHGPAHGGPVPFRLLLPLGDVI